MRRTSLRFKIRLLLIGMAVAAVGLFCFRAAWGGADEIIDCQWSEDWRPWNLGHAIRVRPDVDRLRAFDLSEEDVMRSLEPSRMIDPREPPPPPGVVFGFRVDKDPVPYGNIIVKSNPDGTIVRLKDVAKVKVDW